jgi:hypothetical protein
LWGELRRLEAASGTARRDGLLKLATELDGEASGARAEKTRAIASVLRDLANASR